MVSPNADPVVCKVMDYGKYRYEQQKKNKEAKKKQKVINIKEIRMTPNIEEHDLNVKVKTTKKFIQMETRLRYPFALEVERWDTLSLEEKFLINF